MIHGQYTEEDFAKLLAILREMYANLEPCERVPYWDGQPLVPGYSYAIERRELRRATAMVLSEVFGYPVHVFSIGGQHGRNEWLIKPDKGPLCDDYDRDSPEAAPCVDLRFSEACDMAGSFARSEGRHSNGADVHRFYKELGGRAMPDAPLCEGVIESEPDPGDACEMP